MQSKSFAPSSGPPVDEDVFIRICISLIVWIVREDCTKMELYVSQKNISFKD